MIIDIMFKTPDVTEQPVKEAMLYTDFSDFGINTDEEIQDMEDFYNRSLAKFIRYGECITVRFDTDKQTAIVLPV